MEIITLSNGLRVALEEMPHLRSVSVGVWVKAGSMLERPEENGLSHFMEHMAFKGTARRSARQIAEEMDAVGGQMNAATSKVCTNYYAKVIDEDLPLAMDLLSDIVIHPALDKKEMDKERGVILEEIAMVEDSPEDVVYDVLAGAVYGSQSLGQTILGPGEKIAAYQPADLQAFRARHYGPKNAVVALAGHFDLKRIREQLETYFGDWTGPEGEAFPVEEAVPAPAYLCREKDTEQMHLCVGYRALPLGSPHVYRQAVMNGILGGGMSSRLFQEVRERRGLCYSVYTYGAGHAETGVFAIYTALGKETEAQALETICRTIRDFAEHGPTAEELDRARELSKANVLMGLESTQSRMSALGRGTLLQDRPLTTDEVIEAYNAVTAEDVRALARELFDFSRVSLSAVGRVGDEDYYRGLIEG